MHKYCFRITAQRHLPWLLTHQEKPFGYVVDFLHFHWGGWSFPAFNIADTSITLAAGCLLIGWYLDARYRSKLQG